MSAIDVDAEFRRFVRSGDPAAVAAVFDALAGDLLLVAAHVAWSGTQAEDLVQATFLTAIEQRERFDLQRPVRPWLIAILVNHARSSNRAVRREPDRERLSAGSSDDPASEVEGREVVEAVAAAIESLPEHYRQVLHLRLVHDLELVQIQRALGIPLSTVKSRVSRGTERLRRALPVGVAMSATMALSAERLAAMRSAVLHAVPAKAAAAGLPLLARVALLILALPLAAWGVVAAWPAAAEQDGGVAVGAGGAGVEAGGAAVVVVGEVPAPDTDPIVAAQRDAVAGVDPAPADDRAVLRGRLVAAGSQAGLRGRLVVCPSTDFVNLMLLASQADPEHSQDHGPATFVDTQQDGVFELSCEVPVGVRFRLLVVAPRHVRTIVDLGLLHAGVRELGDIALERGARVAFRVVDGADQPVADAHIAMAPAGEWDVIAGEALGLRVQRGRSSAAGGFEQRLPAGAAYELRSGDNHRLLEPERFVVDGADGQTVTIRVVRFRPAAIITGVVTDRDGVGLSGIDVYQFGAKTRAVTDANGRFRCEAVGGLGGVKLVAEDERELRYDLATASVELPWDGEQVRLEMDRIQGVRLLVVRRSTGQPVERFAVLELPSLGTDVRMRDRPGGRATLPPRAGKTRRFVVQPSGSTCAATSIVEVPADDSILHRVALRDQGAFPVRVVRLDGTPVPRATVQLLDPLAEQASGLETAVWAEELDGGRMPNQILALAEAESDPDGLAVLQTGLGASGLLLRVTGAGHVPAIVRDVTVTTRELQVTVAPAASIAGTIGSAAAARRLHDRFGTRQAMFGARRTPKAPLGVYLTRPGQRLPASDRTYPLSADGAFAATGVPAGDWHVHLWVPGGMIQEMMGGPPVGWSQRIGDVTGLRAGRTATFATDIDAVAFGALRGRVLFDGEPWAERGCRLLLTPTTGGESRELELRVKTDGDGCFTSEHLLVGSYRLVLTYDPEREGRHGHLILPHPASVTAGRVAEHEFSARRRRARVRLLDAGGEPVSGRSFMLRRGVETRGLSDARTDPDGWFVMDPVPYGEFLLVAQVGSRQHEFAVELPEGLASTEWILRLPKTGN